MTPPAPDSTPDPRTEDLRQRIAKRQVVAFVGAGVSMAATRGAATASWKGLLESGIAHCESFVARLPTGWGQRQRDALDAGDLEEMLTVAEQVAKRLRAPDSGEYAGWLRSALDPSALPLHEKTNRRSVPLADMEARAAHELRRYPNSGLGTDGQEFIRLMREDAGILAASGAGRAEFLHLTFQEYLAGLVSQSWWQEVILLALAQGTPAFSAGFFQALLKGDTLERQGGFVERCLAEAEPLIVDPL